MASDKTNIPNSNSLASLKEHSEIIIHQLHAPLELMGFEARNKYEILDKNKNKIGFAAEQQKGFLGVIARQFLGHWRSFDILIFDLSKQLVIQAKHPFKFFFQRLEVKDAGGQYLGAIQQRFSIFTKRFDVEDAHGRVIMEVASPIWKLWTFVFKSRSNQQVAAIHKKWSGVLSEIFTDKDNFLIEMSESLTVEERKIIIAAALFVDLQYFERKAGSRY